MVITTMVTTTIIGTIGMIIAVIMGIAVPTAHTATVTIIVAGKLDA